MKIATNFTSPLGNLVPPLLAVLWGTVAITVVLSLWLVISAITSQLQQGELKQHLTQIEERLEKTSLPEFMPSKEKMSDLKQRVAMINSVADSHSGTVLHFLAKLEGLLPKQAYLVSVHHRLKQGEAVVLAEANSVDILTSFLMKLEKDPDFSEVLLAKQSQRNNRGVNYIQFELRLKQRTL